MKPSDLASGPLGQYQITTFDKEDTWRLVRDINSRLPHPHHGGLLRRNFDANWAALEQKLGAIEAKAATPEPATKPKEEKSPDAGARDSESHAVAHAAFGRLRQELSELMTLAKSSRPTSGRASEMPAMEKDHADRMKAAIQGWLSRARAEASKVSLAGYLAPLAELDATRTEYFELDKFAQRQMAAADAILRKVG